MLAEKASQRHLTYHTERRCRGKSIHIHFEHGYGWDRAEYKIVPTSQRDSSSVEPFYHKTDDVPWGQCEVYIGFSVYLPGNWTDVPGGSILMQIHMYNAPAPLRSNPPFAISVREDGHFWAVSRWHRRGERRTQVEFDLGPIVRDQWVDFQIRMNLTYEAADGLLTIRRRNPATETAFTQMAHFEGTRGTLPEPYSAADNTKLYEWGPEIKFGQYKWSYRMREPAPGEQTVWNHWQDRWVVSECNEGNWEMVSPSGQGF